MIFVHEAAGGMESVKKCVTMIEETLAKVQELDPTAVNDLLLPDDSPQLQEMVMKSKVRPSLLTSACRDTSKRDYVQRVQTSKIHLHCLSTAGRE